MAKKPVKKRAPKKSKAVAKPYEPTEREQAAIDAVKARKESSSPAPMIKVGSGQKTKQIHPDHPDLATGTALLMEALGTTNGAFLEGIIMQLTHATSRGSEVNLKGLNFMLSMVTGIEPKDQMEVMLAAQMAAVHMQMMTFARRLSNADTYLEGEMAEKAFNKLARTFATQIEALNRYRGKGQQKMTVEHVHVHDGGQAIVGQVAQGGGATEKDKGQSHAYAITNAPQPTLRSEDQKKGAVPVTGDA